MVLVCLNVCFPTYRGQNPGSGIYLEHHTEMLSLTKCETNVKCKSVKLACIKSSNFTIPICTFIAISLLRLLHKITSLCFAVQVFQTWCSFFFF